ncbi:MAG: LPS translocon maturation chaperone LptM [Pseudomonadota bacterium]
MNSRLVCMLVASIVLGCALAGCGQMGPLYFDEEPPADQLPPSRKAPPIVPAAAVAPPAQPAADTTVEKSNGSL